MEEVVPGIGAIPRKSLAFLPTPLIELPRFSASLRGPGGAGPRVFMKRDDQTGLAMGGNKARKLEFLVGEALSRGCDTLVTGGAAQSNHCRQTAAAAAACGLACHLVLGGEEPARAEGNLLLDRLLGATVRWAGELRRGESLPAYIEELCSAGRSPYLIPYGGSNALGALGFAAAFGELASQLEESALATSRIVFASSSGGTQAGLMLGRKIYGPSLARAGLKVPRLTGIAIDKPELGSGDGLDLAARALAIANAAAELLSPAAGGGPAFDRSEVELREEFTGGGYGVVGALERRAIRALAESEGILVDPVYTGRALGGLISLVESGEIKADETVVFWHTGGAPALFAYADALGPH